MTKSQTETDTQFSDLISNAVAERMTPEFIEKAVLERVDKLVMNAVDNALHSYSDTGKLIEKAVEDSLRVNNLNLASYGETITKILKAQIEKNVAELVSGRLSQDMEQLLKLAPKEIRLSEIVETMTEPYKEDGGYGEVVTCIVEVNEYGSTWVYLDGDTADQEKYRCDVRFLLNEDGTISSATLRGEDLKDKRSIGRDYGISQLFRAYYACGTKIIIDEDNVVISVGDY